MSFFFSTKENKSQKSEGIAPTTKKTTEGKTGSVSEDVESPKAWRFSARECVRVRVG